MSNFDSNAAGPTIVIFGASGDLTRRKLIPALYNNLIKKRLAAVLRIVGFARRDWRDDQFRDHRGSGVKKHATGFDARVWKEFSRKILYFQGDLATAPDFYVPACDHLSAAGMSVEQSGRRRIIIEKPFGHDLTSARALNRQVHAAFAEHQVYRIDHYLSKETAQAGWRRVVAPAVRLGIPVPAISAALAYFDGYRSARLPANLLQAQRDYFGAHTYERIDKPRGTFFHTNWTGHGGSTSSSTYDV